MKAIQTLYRGYRFRSRLEARYAVLFDKLGVTWRYEPEGFDLGAVGWYLPDFWLETVQMWAEVKPGPFTHEEMAKCRALALQSGSPCIMLDGDPVYRPYNGFDPRFGDPLEQDWLIDRDYLDEHRFYSGTGGGEFKPDTIARDAYLAARQARFEHGETPR